MSLHLEVIRELQQKITGEVRTDLSTRLLYSTDASSYQIEPLGVIVPRTMEDLIASVEIAARHKLPILARGAGSSLAGQAIGQALILDCSRYLTKIIEINVEERTATVEPGVILTSLNARLAKHNLTFGPDPTSADRATMGGSIANNASGAHSIRYGMSVDHLLTADVVLADGSLATLEPVSMAEAERRGMRAPAEGHYRSIEAQLYRVGLDIRSQHGESIRRNWPKIWRRASGYNLNYLVPWSGSKPPGWNWEMDGDGSSLRDYPLLPSDQFNLAPLLAGSEGTLFVIRSLKLRLVSKPRNTILGILTFPSIAQACDSVPQLLELRPFAVELMPGVLLELARSIPAYARQLDFIQGLPEAMLMVEFSGDDLSLLKEQFNQLAGLKASINFQDALIIESLELQKQVANIRKVGLGLIMSRTGDQKGVPFIEDVAVPVERLGEFVREMNRIFNAYGTDAVFYAHASAGCLHLRPRLNLKTSSGVKDMRTIAEETFALVQRLGGVMSGEHGDGLARSEWNERIFGPEMIGFFERIKAAADPDGILNPGKILHAPPMDTNLRYGPGYHAAEWSTVLDFSSQNGLAGAIEMCNGAGVCRNENGVMCPSFQVTKDEMYSTRGRGNLLRAMISGKFPSEKLGEKVVFETLDLCLACKGCKSECPSAVDMAKLRYEFNHHYYQSHRRKLRDYLFGYIGVFVPLGEPLRPLVNALLKNNLARQAGERMMGLSAKRPFPQFAHITGEHRRLVAKMVSGPDVLFLSDTFSRYFHPETEAAALKALNSLGLKVQVIPVLGAGRTLISKGFLKAAKTHAQKLISAIQKLDPQGRLPLVGIEPSEIYTLRDEFLDFFPGDERVIELSCRTWMIDEFLVRPSPDGRPWIDRISSKNRCSSSQQVLLHGHCYQKSRPPADDGYPIGVAATQVMLEKAGYQVEVVDAGCCGMAGAFGYEVEHYELSIKVGELSLLPEVRAAGPETIIAAVGTSCRSQIVDNSEKSTIHPISLIG